MENKSNLAPLSIIVEIQVPVALGNNSHRVLLLILFNCIIIRENLIIIVSFIYFILLQV